ncbi:MAG: hypothetical protein RRY08_05675 [Christensenella sp.]
MDQKTFRREQASRKTKSYIVWGIMGGVFLCVNALMSVAAFGALGLIDVALVAALTLGVHLKQSRVCATILLLLFVISNAVSAYFVKIDIVSLILIAIIGYTLVCGVLGTFAFQKEWKTYCDKNNKKDEQQV